MSAQEAQNSSADGQRRRGVAVVWLQATRAVAALGEKAQPRGAQSEPFNWVRNSPQYSGFPDSQAREEQRLKYETVKWNSEKVLGTFLANTVSLARNGHSHESRGVLTYY